VFAFSALEASAMSGEGEAIALDGQAPDAPVSAHPGIDIPALAAALLTVVLWGSAFVGIRSAGRSFSPGGLTLGRMAVAVCVLGLLLVLRGERVPRLDALRKCWPALLGCSLLWFFAYNLTLNAGERRVDAGTAAMITNVGPVIIALLAGRFLGEGYPGALFAGCVVAFCGVAVIAFASATKSSTTAGVALCLGAALSYAGGVVLQKGVLRVLSPLQTIFGCCAISLVASLPFAGQLISEVSDAGGRRIAWLCYLGAFPTAIAFTTWAFALGRSNAGRLGAMTYLVPPISVLLGWMILGETPVRLALLGGAMCLGGVAITRR
jgi:drug/metabolite transporter (DMT)-like permease